MNYQNDNKVIQTTKFTQFFHLQILQQHLLDRTLSGLSFEQHYFLEFQTQ